MITATMPLNDSLTLAQRLSEGRLPAVEALRYAIQLAQALRNLHESGKAHGAVTPSNLVLAAGRLALLPAAEGWARAITPYTAPEVVQGHAADERSDLFSLGAILFEMLTGRRAFDGESRAALAANLTMSPVPTSGNAAVDRVVGPLLSKNPDARVPRMKKVMMELKMLSVAARHTGMGSGSRLLRDPAVDSGQTRAEMQQLEARVAARLRVHERTVAEMHRSASEAMSSLKLQVAAMSSELAENYEGAGEGIGGREGRGFEALHARIGQIEGSVEEMRRHVSQFEHNMAADLMDIEQTIKAQSAAIESSRTAMSQTDDLVERVVEALESLQTAVLEVGEGRLRATSEHPGVEF
jgi:eukaryotic-like serine/threonine-protein kinase